MGKPLYVAYTVEEAAGNDYYEHYNDYEADDMKTMKADLAYNETARDDGYLIKLFKLVPVEVRVTKKKVRKYVTEEVTEVEIG